MAKRLVSCFFDSRCSVISRVSANWRRYCKRVTMRGTSLECTWLACQAACGATCKHDGTLSGLGCGSEKFTGLMFDCRLEVRGETVPRNFVWYGAPGGARLIEWHSRWHSSFDGPCAFLATLLILYFCCVPCSSVVTMWKINSLSRITVVERFDAQD